MRRACQVLFRPLAVAFEPSLDAFEGRLERRLSRLEDRVSIDAEVIAEMTSTQARSLGRIEERLRELEGLAPEMSGGAGGSRMVGVPWAISILAGLAVPSRIGLDASGEVLFQLSLAALGHEVLVVAGAAADHPGIRSCDLQETGPADLDAAVALCSERFGAKSPDPAVLTRLAARLRPGGSLLLTAPVPVPGELESVLSRLRVISRSSAAESVVMVHAAAP